MKSRYCFSLDGLTFHAKKSLETLIISLGVECFVDESFLYVTCTKCEWHMIDDIVNAALAIYVIAH